MVLRTLYHDVCKCLEASDVVYRECSLPILEIHFPAPVEGSKKPYQTVGDVILPTNWAGWAGRGSKCRLRSFSGPKGRFRGHSLSVTMEYICQCNYLARVCPISTLLDGRPTVSETSIRSGGHVPGKPIDHCQRSV